MITNVLPLFFMVHSVVGHGNNTRVLNVDRVWEAVKCTQTNSIWVETVWM